MADTPFEATTELGKAMEVVTTSAEGLASAFGELSDESKVWTIASRILSGSGLWKLQNRIRALGQITAWYNRLKVAGVKNQIKAAEQGLEEVATLKKLAIGKEFVGKKTKGMAEAYKYYQMYKQENIDKGIEASLAEGLAVAKVKAQYETLHDALNKNRLARLSPNRLSEWIFKGKTFDDDGKERTDGKGFFSNEISRWWKKEGAISKWLKRSDKLNQIWLGLSNVGGGLKRIVSAAGFYFVTAMYYFTLIATGIGLLVFLIQKMQLRERFAKITENVNGFVMMFQGVILIFKGIFEMLKSAFTGDMPGLAKGLGKVFAGVMSIIIGLIIGGIQVLITIVLGALGGIVKLLLKVPLVGGALRALGVKEFAKGGITPGGMVLVGEEGPELVNLPKGSRVHSNAESRRMGGNNIHVHVNGRVGASDAEIRDIANKVAREVNLRMNRTGATAGRF